MSEIIHLEPSQVPEHLRLGYRGRRFKVSVCNRVKVPLTANRWDDGSRDDYRLVDIATGRQRMLMAGDNVDLGNGIVVIMSSIFMGKSSGLMFFMHESDSVKLLIAPEKLTRNEIFYLIAARDMKSSYGGKDRYVLLQRELQATLFSMELYPTRHEWERTREILMTKSLVNFRGSITVSGRNAISGRGIHNAINT